ncbi:substrate-binding domain-containing protein [bacterium]|jgi:tungstate transport system substrate-binding protein|nr:substrate-binding domain-containing protein [bacterium]
MIKKTLLTLGLSTLMAMSLTANDSLMMATTTSTEDTGLLDYLAPQFEKDTGTTLKWVATGTGKALKMGENCDVDVLLVHAPSAEKKFVDEGFGVNRNEVMFNDFVIIGPVSDPAGISGKSTDDAFKEIKEKKANFLSRGDNSGTHKKELGMWEKVSKIVPEKDSWYVQTGQGMIATINMASEKSGYTLTDRGTWIKYESQKGDKNNMKIVVENDNSLFNQYSVITVNKDKCPNVKTKLASDFSNWIVKDETQKLIGDFKLLNKPLFTPNAKK